MKSIKFINKLYNWWDNDTLFDYRVGYAFTHPKVIFKGVKNELKWAYQRVFYGYDDRVIWGIDTYLSRFMPIWLNKLKNKKQGIPSELFDDGEINNITDEIIDKKKIIYDEILDKIILGFESYYKIENFDIKPYTEEYNLATERYKKGFELFLKYFHTLRD